MQILHASKRSRHETKSEMMASRSRALAKLKRDIKLNHHKAEHDSALGDEDKNTPIQKDEKIPRQLILTGKPDSLEELPATVQRNVKKAMALNPTLKVRWLGDNACLAFLKEHPELGLQQAFESEKRHNYRGDLCRSAVLAVEGGYYQDTDVALTQPFRKLVGKATFMSAVADGGASLLNAIMAATPDHPIMAKTVKQLKTWYQGNERIVPGELMELVEGSEWMGPVTLKKGVESFIQEVCPKMTWERATSTLEWHCGSHTVRLYREQRLNCEGGVQLDAVTAEKSKEKPWSKESGCTKRRMMAEFEGLQFGLFTPAASIYDGPGPCIGWPRFEDCAAFGCDAGGWEEDPSEQSLAEQDASTAITGVEEPTAITGVEEAISIAEVQDPTARYFPAIKGAEDTTTIPQHHLKVYKLRGEY